MTAIPDRPDWLDSGDWSDDPLPLLRERFAERHYGRAVTYERGPDEQVPDKVQVSGTVIDVSWPGSFITDDDGRWHAFRLLIETGDGEIVESVSFASEIPAPHSGSEGTPS